MAEYDIPDDLRYSSEDEWARQDAERWVVGITDYAQQQLGDIVFVELPEVGASVSAGDTFGVVESVKAVSDLYSPLGGEIVEVNQALADQPELLNEDCYGLGWLVIIEGDEGVESLLDASAYRKHVQERSG